MRSRFRVTSVAILGLCATSASAQQRPAIRQLGSITAKSAETFAAVAGIRALSNGTVLVNDVSGRRVLLFDSQLAKFSIVADSTSATANAYGGRVGSLVAYRGDSSIFVDPASVSMLVIDGSGKIARVMAIPRAEDAAMIGGALGNSVFDAAGRLVYRAGAGFRMGGGRPMPAPQHSTPGAARTPQMQLPDPPDSAFILGVNLATRKLDTLGYIRTPKIKLEMQHDDNGNMRVQSMINPLPVIDDWAVMPDGAIAFVRGRDYHVDWVNPDGSKTSSAKIPFDWQRMTDEDKQTFLDSAKAARERLGANAPMPAAGAAGQAGAARGGDGGGAPQVMVFSQTIGGPGGPQATRTSTQAPQMTFVPASELPDYKPAFFAGSTRADPQGNLWIRTIPTTAVAGGPVYDIVNRKGELIDRVQIPANRTIIGFGADGGVYLVNREGNAATLERATLR